MPQVQTSYTERHENAFAGMIANPQTCDLDSLEFRGATGVAFGRAVQQGPSARTCMAGVAANTFRGVAVIDKTLQPSQNDEYVEGDVASILWRGDVWVPVETAVSARQDVTVNGTTGQFSSAAAAPGGNPQRHTIAGARWMTDQTTAGGLALLRLAGPVPAA